MKKFILSVVLLVLTAIQGLFAYAYATGQFADLYHSFGQDLPTLYTPITTLLGHNIAYKLMFIELLLGIVLVVKDKFIQTYSLIGVMSVVILLMIYGLYGNVITR